MPELPEVETIKIGLQKKILGLIIEDVEILAPKSFIGNVGVIKDKKIKDIWRRAKILGIELSDDITILFHLKMSGQLIFEGKKRFIGGHPTQDMLGELPNKSTRVIITFDNHSKLYFNDQRRFGWVRVIREAGGIREITEKLGPEPLEESFTWEILKERLLKRKSLPIKVALLDQTVVAGIGNIYASEACFIAEIDPRKKVGDLGDREFQKLYKGVIDSLQAGIKYGGSTRVHFVDPEGNKGYFLDYAFVYGKDKKPCKNCGTIIEKIQLRGRGTYFCTHCQV